MKSCSNLHNQVSTLPANDTRLFVEQTNKCVPFPDGIDYTVLEFVSSDERSSKLLLVGLALNIQQPWNIIVAAPITLI